MRHSLNRAVLLTKSASPSSRMAIVVIVAVDSELPSADGSSVMYGLDEYHADHSQLNSMVMRENVLC